MHGLLLEISSKQFPKIQPNLMQNTFWVKTQILCKEVIYSKIKEMTSFTGYQFQPSLTLLGERGFIYLFIFFWTNDDQGISLQGK